MTETNRSKEKMICGQCGMLCDPEEYHPYAACLMFMQCHDAGTVRANLDAVYQQGREDEANDRQ